MTLIPYSDDQAGLAIYFVTPSDIFPDAVPDGLRRFAEAQNFQAKAGAFILMPDQEGAPTMVLAGLGSTRNPLNIAALSAKLPTGTYSIAYKPEDWPLAWIAAGWEDGCYHFGKYKDRPRKAPILCLPDSSGHAGLIQEAEAAHWLRDLINTPAEDMGPSQIEAEMQALAEAYKADLTIITGDALLAENYPMIHAVGRAAKEAPRLIKLCWGNTQHPELALVGKGVAFDTGGLNLKTGNFMRLMKKDMGGAAHAMALARLIMGANLPVSLKLYIPAVENAISGGAFRPGDVLSSRKGLKIEIDNTDAEGRLILGDALCHACESKPDLILDFATLTGAARVALGPDLAPFFTDEETLSDSLLSAARASGDPVWRLPLWDPYLSYLDSSVGDISNAGGRMGGAIIAALFLKQFVDISSWIHFDVWGWREAKYGQPQGGAPCGLRAVWHMLQARYAS